MVFAGRRRTPVSLRFVIEADSPAHGVGRRKNSAPGAPHHRRLVPAGRKDARIVCPSHHGLSPIVFFLDVDELSIDPRLAGRLLAQYSAESQFFKSLQSDSMNL